MRILCPEQFHEACLFALQSDEARDAEIARAEVGHAELDTKTLADLRMARGLSIRSLLSCFGARANSERLNNKDLWLPDTSVILMQDGRRTTPGEMRDTLVSETVISADYSPHSFFFREAWFFRSSREEVEIHDKVWYVFDPSVPSLAVDALSDGPSNEQLDAYRRDNPTLCHKFFRPGDELPGGRVVTRSQRRIGMCGGIVYHPDWIGGKRAEFGSWSTHT